MARSWLILPVILLALGGSGSLFARFGLLACVWGVHVGRFRSAVYILGIHVGSFCSAWYTLGMHVGRCCLALDVNGVNFCFVLLAFAHWACLF